MKNYLRLLMGKTHRPLKISPKRIHYGLSSIITDYLTYSIVGNGPVKNNLIEHVEASDVVIRFNFPQNTALTGTNTDALIITNHDNPHLALRPKCGAALAVKNAAQLWLTHTEDVIRKYRIPRNEDSKHHLRYNNWVHSLIWQHGLRKKNFMLRTEVYSEALNFININNNSGKRFYPSSGFLAVYTLMKFNPNAHVKLFGFTHEGWSGHGWEAEKNYIDKLTKEDRLTRVY